jgi:hypothetical protein
MKAAYWRLVLVTLALAPLAAAGEQLSVTFNFDTQSAGSTPAGFEFSTTGRGLPGRWVIQATAFSPSGGNVLAQTSTDDNEDRFPIAYTGPAMTNLRLSVKCRSVSGRVSQRCGLVFRLQNANNYYAVSAGPLRHEVRVDRVLAGSRRKVGVWETRISEGMWHELTVEARGDRFEVFLDGSEVGHSRDAAFVGAGKFGVWTQADSVVQFDFDDLRATPE